MAGDDRDAFGNPIGGTAAPAGASLPSPAPGLTADLGGFSPPVAPTPKVVHPPPRARHVIAGGHPSTGGTPAAARAPAGPVPVEVTVALVLGIAGIMLLVPAPLAWYRSRQAIRMIDGAREPVRGRGIASFAQFLGILGTAVLVFSVAGVVEAAVSGRFG